MGRPSVHQAIALLAATSILPATRLEGFPIQAAAALLLIAAWRIAAGRAGDALAGPRPRVALRAISAIATFLLLAAMTRGSMNPLAGLLVLLAMIQALSLIETQAPFVSFLIILLATAQVTGAAFVREDAVGLTLTLLALATLLGAALLFERRMTSIRTGAPGTTVHRVRIGDPQQVPGRALLKTFAGLWLTGLLGGAVLALALPWVASLGGGGDARAAAEAQGGGDEESEESITGLDSPSKGIRLGDIGRIKVDLTPYFEVRLPPNRRPFMRESTYEVYRDRTWLPLKGEGVPKPRDFRADPETGGWVMPGRDDDPGRAFEASAVVLRGPMPRLCLERDVVRMRFVRGGRLLPLRVIVHDNEQTDVRPPLVAGDLVQLRAVPPIRDDRLLERARSDARVSPRASYLQLPEACRPLVAEARRIVGDETNAWRQALHLVDWLRDGDFSYTLEMPVVSTEHPVVDFVLTAKRGHCEYFAAALALMLRGLGHPARLVKGFRGGDWQDTRESWVIRGSHTHVWTEMYFEPHGWIALDATPPDDEAVDAATFTEEATGGGADGDDGEEDWLASLLGLTAEDREAIVTFARDVLDRFVLGPVTFLFGPRGFFVGFLLLVLLNTVFQRRRIDRVEGRGRGGGRREPRAPYLEALKLLSAVGLRRQRAATPREFLREVRTWAPEVREDLAWLTVIHERMRYGAVRLGRDGDRQARVRVGQIGRTLKRRGRGSRRA